MSKVETQTVTGYQGTSLLYMATKYGTQRFMKQMGCGMVLRGKSVHGFPCQPTWLLFLPPANIPLYYIHPT